MRDLGPIFWSLRKALRRHLCAHPIRSAEDFEGLLLAGAEILVRRLPGLPESDAVALLAAAVLLALRGGQS